MKKGILSIGIIFLFIVSTVSPIVFGNNTMFSEEDKLLEKYGSSITSPFKYPDNEIWIKTYGGGGAEWGEYVQQTSDNGYVIVGWTNSYGAGSWDIWLVKTDIDGNELWNKTYGGRYDDVAYCVRETTDKGFIISGYSKVSSSGPYDTWLIKTDSNGNVSWDRKFRGKCDFTLGECVIELDDGYLVLARMHNDFPFKDDIWLIRTDSDGIELWNKYIGVGNYEDDRGNAVIQTSEGDFVIIGRSYSSIYGYRILLIKTDSNGNMIWRKTFNGMAGNDIKECDDGSYIIIGQLDFILIKTDIDGNLVWQKEYQWVGDGGLSVDLTSDGGFIVTGNGGPIDCDLLILKIDENGNREWENRFGGVGESDGGSCVIQSNDDAYVVTGNTATFGTGLRELWLVKVAQFENQRPNKPTINGPTNGKPFKEYIFSMNATEPDNEQLFYWFELGDEIYIPWQGPYESGEICNTSIYWLKRNSYTIRVKAQDIYGGDSEWAEHTIIIPRNKATYNSFLLRFLERRPLLNRLLDIIVK